jgi:hypothetical protein
VAGLSPVSRKRTPSEARFQQASFALSCLETLMTAPKLSSQPRRTRLVAAGAFTAFFLQANAASCPAAMAGPTMNRVNSVCEAHVETDDFGNPQVQACVRRLTADDHVKGAPYENCRVNKKLKTELCATRIKLGSEKNLQACVSSPDTVPRQVSAGLGQ